MEEEGQTTEVKRVPRDPKSEELLQRLQNMMDADQLASLLEDAVRQAKAGRGKRQISEAALKEVSEAYDRYQNIVREAPLSPTTKTTYLLHSHNFLKWLDGEFVPGGRIR